MKNSIKFIAVIVISMATLVGFASCDKDDNSDPLAIKSINVEYTLDLNQTWFDYFDIAVTYFDDKGKQNTLTVTEKWSYKFSVSPKVAPKNYLYTVVATPKNNLPEIVGTQYILSTDIVGDFFCYRYDGSVFKELSSDLHPFQLTNTDVLTFSAEQFKDYLEGGSRTLMNFTKSWDGKY